MSYSDISPIDVDGTVSSSIQGMLIGSLATMPTASADYDGITVQYTGATSGGYVHNAFYRCGSNGQGGYAWTKVTSGDDTAGSLTHPIYMNAGVPTPTTYSMGTAAPKNVAAGVAEGNIDLPTSGAVYSAISDAKTAVRQGGIVWDAALTYANGVVVSVADSLYMSKMDGNRNHDPTASPAYWEKIELGSPEPVEDINPCNVYKVSGIGDGISRTYSISHNLGTYDVDVLVYETSTGRATSQTHVERTSENVVVLTFATAPASGEFNVVVFRPGTSVSSVCELTGVVTASELRTALNVADGAEVNVNADWTAVSGDAQILNKPTLGTAAALDTGTGAGNVPVLDANGKLVDSVMPDLAISDFLGTVALVSGLSGLTAQKGDWAQVTADTAANNGAYIYTGAAWQRLASAAEVTAVNGHVGAVTLRQTSTIVGDGSTSTFTVAHSLGVIPSVSLYENDGQITATRCVATASNITLTFYSAPAVGETYTVVMNE